MNNRRRYRVVARPQARARRARSVAAVLATLLLGGLAVAAARRAVADFRLPRLPPLAPGDILVEAPEPLRSLAQAVADATPGPLADKAAAIAAKFPCVVSARPRRSWTEKRATIALTLRRPVAPVARRGVPAGYLGDDGTPFSAPEGVYALSGPAVELDGAPAAETAALAREWPVLSAPGAFPAPLVAMAWRGADAGWEARLEDGAEVAWGRLEWTREKLARLAEAVADAKAREPGSFSADLRWFEDGKVLLRPSAPAGARR